MNRRTQVRQYKKGGLTFTVIKESPPKELRDAVEDLYPNLVSDLAKRAHVKRDVARETVHDLVVQELAKKRKDIDEPAAYLGVAAYRGYVHSRRDEKRFVPLGTFTKKEQHEIMAKRRGSEPWPGDSAAKLELSRRVWELLELLPLRQRYVLAMWCFDLGIGEIAAELRTTPENVRFHKHAAIQSMRARLGVKIDESA